MLLRDHESREKVLSRHISKYISTSHLLELIFRSQSYADVCCQALLILGTKVTAQGWGACPQGREFWGSVWVEGGSKETGI